MESVPSSAMPGRRSNQKSPAETEQASTMQSDDLQHLRNSAHARGFALAFLRSSDPHNCASGPVVSGAVVGGLEPVFEFGIDALGADAHPRREHRVEAAGRLQAAFGRHVLEDQANVEPHGGRRLKQRELSPLSSEVDAALENSSVRSRGRTSATSCLCVSVIVRIRSSGTD